ncbi:CotH kinase family protein [Cryobacterium arcticum]|uniref:Spore coat assembly protein n=1 Tax=Cryobacterium arcticum TaxID=670052 RepID=A0A1B1BIL3_9MICO|nr:CotH kinase family protein [Cryobacterium arcticum]ANP72358.1 Spore coat assembly protein [Cryobacterium arcticum]
MRQPHPAGQSGRSSRSARSSRRSRAAATPIAAVVIGVLALGGLTACDSTGAVTSSSSLTAEQAAALVGADFYDTGLVHSVTIDYDEADYQAMLAAYTATGDKGWISATVTIDGTVFEQVGLRLKGNSSLRGIGDTAESDDDTATGTDAPADTSDGSVDTDSPESLPWLIRLDKYVDGQSYQDRTEFVVRGNTTESSLNEAVALELIGLSGLETEKSAAVRLSVNGGDDALRLVMESIDDDLWNEDTFENDGITYKAESDGDYSYRGDDPADYVDVFNQKTGEDDLTPLIAFLDFINNSDDATFAAELGNYLDLESFATYLAVEDLTDNFDDIDGPGNNSYLRYDSTTGLMTVVAWDANLSFGTLNGGGAMGGMGEGGPDGGDRGTLPDGTAPTGAAPDGAAGGQGGGLGGYNILATRFLADSTFSALVDTATASLSTSLYANGDAQAVLDRWTALLADQAGDLIDSGTLQSESDAIASYFTGDK